MFRWIITAFALFFQSQVTLANCYKPPDVIGTCGVEQSIFKATNQFRAQNGVAPLQYRAELNWSARKWSESMAATGQISHAGFPTTRNQTIILEFPTSNQQCHGENVAYFQGYKPGDIGQFFVGLWIQSPGHRQNMLRPFRYMGVGYARKGDAHYATQNFAW